VPEVIDRFRFNGPIFSAVAALAGPVAATGFAVAAGRAIAALARRRLSLASPQGWAWPMAATLLAAPLVYPWYLVWLTPFLVVPQTLPLTIWTLSILSTYVVWRLVGVPWAMPVWALLIEYGALLAAAFWLWRRRSGERPTEAPSRSPIPPP
jgi:alpha-1,6-mannosyltransferase